MLHACDQRFDVMGNLENFCELNKALKDSSHNLQINCAISFYFHLYLITHARAVKFDMMRNLKKFLIFSRN